jgi:hypothetical protein
VVLLFFNFEKGRATNLTRLTLSLSSWCLRPEEKQNETNSKNNQLLLGTKKNEERRLKRHGTFLHDIDTLSRPSQDFGARP